MMKLLQRLSFFLVFLFFSNSMQATHLVGGEMRYKCLGNDQYELTIIIYRDSVNGNPGAWFDNPLSLGVFDPVTGVLLSSDTLFLDSYGGIPMPAYFGNMAPLHNIGFQKGIYKKILTLPYRTNGYQLSYQRCCRNNLIQNLSNPTNTGFTMTIELTETALTSCNSSPVPVQDVPLFLCVADSFSLSMGATDADGDSMSYHFYTPFDGASQGNPAPNPPLGPSYLAATWVAPYSQNNQAPNTYLDSLTGRFYGQHNTTGYFAMGVSIREYRAGQLISTTYRDFSLSMIPCAETVGIDKVEELFGCTIYPNPMDEFLTIEVNSEKEVSVRLLNAIGQEVEAKQFYNSTQLNTDNLPRGIYFVELRIGKQQYTKKVIKE